MKNLTLFLLVALLIIGNSCKDPIPNEDYVAKANCTNVTASYAKDVKPILDRSCALSGCHNAASNKEGVNLSDYANSKFAFQNKAVLCSVHHGDGCKDMPQDANQLSDTELQLFDCWVKNSYPQ